LEDSGDRVLSLGLSTEPVEDRLLPGIALAPLLLLLGGEDLDLALEPPVLPGLEACYGLGPELIAIALQRV
jgi:hypothetical protein